jgi:hypothetical protein
MILLSPGESRLWTELAASAALDGADPGRAEASVRTGLRAVFDLYMGVLLASRGDVIKGKEWLRRGAMQEDAGVFLNTYLLAFLERQGNRLVMPAVAFEDPRPYVHFTTVPSLKGARNLFARALGNSMQPCGGPFRVMDIGTGDGSMLLTLLKRLREAGKISDIGEIFLVDQSSAMIELASATVGGAFPGVKIRTAVNRIEEISGGIEGVYDLAVAALSYHHMPIESKVLHLERLKRSIRQFAVFELDANNDTPGQGTPDLALSLYQSYGRMIDFVFAHDAPIEVANRCVDNFLMTELVSFLIHPRGVRTDYHMMSSQWRALFDRVLGDRYFLLGEAACYADEYFSLFMMHYGS